MHRGMWMVALALLLLAGSSAQAQRRGPIFFGGGVDPTELIFVPIDTRQSVVPIASPEVRSTTFRFLDLIPRISLGGSRPNIGQSIFPSEAQMPGADYLKAFQFKAARPIGN